MLPDYPLFRALPGAGPALAPHLLAAFGEQRERYAAPQRSRGTSVLPPSPSVAATNAGCTGACNAPRSCAKPSWSGPPSRSHTVTGPRSIIINNAPREPPTRQRCAPWPSSGFASCIAAGRIALPTTRRPTSTHLNDAAHRCSLDSETSNLNLTVYLRAWVRRLSLARPCRPSLPADRIRRCPYPQSQQ
jgi:hypothetical protein